MNNFCLGIVGKCTSLQPWIHPSALYHRQLRTLLQENDEIHLRVKLAGRSDLEPYERIRMLHARIPLDGVLYHVRIFDEPTLLNSTRDSSGEIHYSLHPYFFKRFIDKRPPPFSDVYFPRLAALATQKTQDTHNSFVRTPNPSPRKLLGITFRKINLFGAKLCGLNAWVNNNEWAFFERLRKYCFDLNIPLFVLGPIPRVELSPTHQPFLVSHPSRQFIERRLSKDQIPHFVLHDMYDEKGMPLHKTDGVHLSYEGHTFLAKKLYPLMTPWIKSILSEKQPTLS